VRVALDEIVAVTSARNYVEFHLADGARPLVRSTLAKVEADLLAGGFLRTHRSWLVNPAHVRVLEPAAGGDFRLELATGVTAPLSRRFPHAIEVLRDAA
jgi:DNA-binding LytR/AlgR family response regulator